MVSNPYRVMVVDDSAVIRGLITRILESDGAIKVVSSAANGNHALTTLKSHLDIEAIILDIEMPVMDGLTALPLLIKQNPDIKIIMASTLTLRNAEISMKALQLGACDYVPKPSTHEVSSGYDFKRELTEKIIAHVSAHRATLGGGQPKTARASVSDATLSQSKTQSQPDAQPKPGITLRKLPLLFNPSVLAIGSSTGGPQALFKVLGDIGDDIKLPILITQHMPATFTTILANHISSLCNRPASEAVDGEEVRNGHIYVAPGDYHMLIREKDGKKIIALNQNPPVNFCRPAVDPMFESLAAAYGRNCLALILTGMGHDGMVGGQHIVDGGGVVIAQDQQTSVVWGMPGSAAEKGICSAVLPLNQIGHFVRNIVLKVAA